jgi:hypothetical protein
MKGREHQRAILRGSQVRPRRKIHVCALPDMSSLTTLKEMSREAFQCFLESREKRMSVILENS